MGTRSLRELFKDAVALMAEERYEQALARLDLLIEHAPTFTPAYIQRGTVHSELSHWELAQADLERALHLDPDNPDFKWIVSMIDLQLGNLGRGWELYESRWQCRAFRSPKLHTNLPRWQPGCGSRSVLVWYEQGIGDQILYASLLHALQSHAERVTAQIDARLVDLFRRANPGIRFVAHDAHIDSAEFDTQIPLASLAGHFARSLGQLAERRATRYLKPSDEHVQALRASLNLEPEAFLVGLSWASTSPVTGPKKSVKLQDLLALWQIPGLEVVSLQFGPPAAQAESFFQASGRVIRQPGIDNTQDLEGLAALMSLCDAVVTVSNSNAHIAGALGVPTHVLDARHSWYWSHAEHGQSLWYPSARVHAREHALGPWTPQIQSITQDLLAAPRSSRT